jgi:hypothetical protein
MKNFAVATIPTKTINPTHYLVTLDSSKGIVADHPRASMTLLLARVVIGVSLGGLEVVESDVLGDQS